jgi:hypothetical protein
MGTARGGGAVGVNQARDTDLMSKIDNMMFGARTAGAGALGQIGQAQSGVGLGQSGQGIQAGGLASSTAADLGRQALYGREQSDEMHRQAVGDYAKAFGSVIGGFPWDKWGKALGGLFGIGGGGGGASSTGISGGEYS